MLIKNEGACKSILIFIRIFAIELKYAYETYKFIIISRWWFVFYGISCSSTNKAEYYLYHV